MVRAVILKRACVCCIVLASLFCAIGAVSAQSRGSIKLNENSFLFATQLIKQGHVIVDSKGAWGKHRPSADEENEFIRLHGFGEYAKWHLGIDDRFRENTKRRYKFPFGDFKSIHRCGLLAARSRAAEYRYYDIEGAAARLVQMTSGKKYELQRFQIDQL
jgi:hypothetical protein